MSSNTDTSAGHEKRDVRPGVVALITGASLVVLIVAIVALNEYFVSVQDSVREEQAAADTSVTLSELRLREDSLLTTQGVTDSVAGVYRIPIERAMEIMASKANRTDNR